MGISYLEKALQYEYNLVNVIQLFKLPITSRVSFGCLWILRNGSMSPMLLNLWMKNHSQCFLIILKTCRICIGIPYFLSDIYNVSFLFFSLLSQLKFYQLQQAFQKARFCFCLFVSCIFPILLFQISLISFLIFIHTSFCLYFCFLFSSFFFTTIFWNSDTQIESQTQRMPEGKDLKIRWLSICLQWGTTESPGESFKSMQLSSTLQDSDSENLVVVCGISWNIQEESQQCFLTCVPN